MSQNIFKMDLARVATRIRVPAKVSHPLYDGQDMYDYLNTNQHVAYLWIITYTVGDHDITKPIARVIHCLGKPDGRKIKQVKKFADIHTKLFLGFDGKSNPRVAFVGSQNLVAATSHNLNVMLTDRSAILACVAYFNHLWDKA